MAASARRVWDAVIAISGPYAEQVADRVAELGAIQRVEMKVADAAGVKLAASSAATVAAISWRAAGRSSSPSNRSSSQCGILAPQVWANRRVVATFDTGRMPGTISMSIPAAATSSWKRKKQSGEKKNWVIARSAPASTLRFRLSRSAATEPESGWISG